VASFGKKAPSSNLPTLFSEGQAWEAHQLASDPSDALKACATSRHEPVLNIYLFSEVLVIHGGQRVVINKRLVGFVSQNYTFCQHKTTPSIAKGGTIPLYRNTI